MKTSSPYGRRRGSALLLVIISTIVVGLSIGSLARYALLEQRLNYDAVLFLEARNGAESVIEQGFAELARRFEDNTSFPRNSLATDANPLRLTTEFRDFFTANSGGTSNLVLFEGTYDPAQPRGTYATELIGGEIPPGRWSFIDPRVPGNESDPLQGMMVFVRDIEIYGRATVEDFRGIHKTAYARTKLQVRDAPLFAHAIFYNMDMEIAPGAPMTVWGPVHSNGNAYLQSNNSLDFRGKLTATGFIQHGRHPNSGQTNSSGAVRFWNAHITTNANASMQPGGNLDLVGGGTSTWLDHRVIDWRETANTRWRGSVQDSAHGIQRHNPVGVADYERTGSTVMNNAYHLIMSIASPSDPKRNIEVERQKYDYKAGLVVDVNTTTHSIRFLSYKRDDAGDILFDPVTNQPEYVELSPHGHLSDIVRINPYAETTESTSTERTVTGGLFDMRQNQGMNLLEVDMDLLRSAVHGNSAIDWGAPNNAEAAPERPENWWNGIVYVRMPTTALAGREDGVRVSPKNWGVRLRNANSIPNPSFAFTEDIYGTSVATNAPLYTLGHFNADGVQSTGSAQNPDGEINPRTGEPPAAIIADAVTILSSNWDDAKSRRNSGNRNSPTFTEISAAIMTGIVPSGTDGSNYSGGVENFPRFLENWGGTVRYRGSLVALFESEVANRRWGFGNVYSAPTRDWGFHNLYAQGFYPPGTPNVRTYRRIGLRYLASTSEWEETMKKLETALEGS